MAVLLKKDEKIINELPDEYSEQGFIEKFKELYSNYWVKIDKNYQKHLRKVKPEQYLKNTLNVWLKKTKA
jgi:hypothetical protein